ncbi:MAG: S-methyl-5-thioribose-1-phosphate isomerase, partial [Deltaproteobacteria bacterium]|nr:S-methyl-5-thioribose-1-phosphate isomerase [Deltaproteobacteria bacterium]
MIIPVEWKNNAVCMLDQRKLPTEEVWLTLRTHEEVAVAIENMTIRGSGAIGLTAVLGVALGFLNNENIENVCARLGRTRPTAVNLFWALNKMKKASADGKNLVEEALKIYTEEIEANRTMGKHGASLLKDGMTIHTHCNAGSLAWAGFGAVIYAAQAEGKKLKVISDETRPVLQGARLTCWELQKAGIEVTLICDNMAGSMMKRGGIDCVIVGADRIAANGDTVNKIGTYPLAVLAKHHNIPFYVAASCSTIDANIPSGEKIPIEQRDTAEVTDLKGYQIAPAGIKIENP